MSALEAKLAEFELPPPLIAKCNKLLSEFDAIDIVADVCADTSDTNHAKDYIRRLLELVALFVPRPAVLLRVFHGGGGGSGGGVPHVMQIERSTSSADDATAQKSFLQEATRKLEAAFDSVVVGTTGTAMPSIPEVVQDSISADRDADAGMRRMHIFLFDPRRCVSLSEADRKALTAACVARSNPEHPLTFVTDAAWAANIEAVAPNVSSVCRTFDMQRLRVADAHGSGGALRFSRGHWLLQSLVGVLVPVLDALDDSVPLTRAAMDFHGFGGDYDEYFEDFVAAAAAAESSSAAGGAGDVGRNVRALHAEYADIWRDSKSAFSSSTSSSTKHIDCVGKFRARLRDIVLDADKPKPQPERQPRPQPQPQPPSNNLWRLPFCFGCCDDVWHESVFCYPCQASRQCHAVEGELDTFTCGHCIVALFGFPCYACVLRQKAAKRFFVDEACVGSTLRGCFCPCCSLAHTHRELMVRHYWPGGLPQPSMSTMRMA